MKFSEAPESRRAFTECPDIVASTTVLCKQFGAPAAKEDFETVTSKRSSGALLVEVTKDETLEAV